MSDSKDSPIGARVRAERERRGMSRDVLAGLVGRSADWLKKIERGDRQLHSVPLILALCRVLGLTDARELMGGDVALPVDAAGRTAHSGVRSLREAVHAPFVGAQVNSDSQDVGVLAGQVRQAWQTWHTSPTQRTDVASVLPGLITNAHSVVRSTTGPERRRAAALASEVYALAQLYAAHNAESGLYWTIVERARGFAEQADEPVVLAGAAWIASNGLRASGHGAEAVRIAADAAGMLRPQLEGAPERLVGMHGALCLSAAITTAGDGHDGEAWRWWDEADRVTSRLPKGYSHPWTAFGRGNVAVHAVTIGAELRTPGSALDRLGTINPTCIPSTERRSRLFLDAARAEQARREPAAALTYLRLAVDTSPEAVRYVPAGRALARDLAHTTRGPLAPTARQLAESVGIG